jgi:putative membrane protein
MANERTLLAYIRTFLAFLLTGAGLIKFTQEHIFTVLGLVFILLSLVTLVVGFVSYFKIRHLLKTDENAYLLGVDDPE